ncbi:hypothetical protein DMN91_012724 [Ooceraea biroi]|uniref:Uncharacterized protein n=1 Tax=Ooceraea biroi TaxID=2015173 RepID=A0A3L8D2V8_OOCBI|nr:hypothetical protein DMN91_012724 [Ooceraea biroi]
MSRQEHRQARAAADQARPVRPTYSPPKEATALPTSGHPTNRPRYLRLRQEQLCAELETPIPPAKPKIRSIEIINPPSVRPAPVHPAPLTSAQFRAEIEALFGRLSDSDPDDALGLAAVEGQPPGAPQTTADTEPPQQQPIRESPPQPPPSTITGPPRTPLLATSDPERPPAPAPLNTAHAGTSTSERPTKPAPSTAPLPARPRAVQPTPGMQNILVHPGPASASGTQTWRPGNDICSTAAPREPP